MFGERYAWYYESFNSDKPCKKCEVNFVYKWAENPKAILDIGCGTAEYWKFWPDGVVIRGLEKSPYMISKSPFKSRIVEGDIATMGQTRIKTGLGGKISYDLVTAIFNVINYVPTQSWWKALPLKPGGYFILDVWDKFKVDKERFSVTSKNVDGASRKITPLNYNGKSVDLEIEVCDWNGTFRELHEMYVWSHEELLEFAGDDFHLVDIKKTKGWQVWYKFQKK